MKKMPLQQQRAHAALLLAQKKTTQTTHYSVVGATFVLMSAILPIYDISWYFPAFTGLIGAACWFMAWRNGR
jgi:ubiquinone biosynthesis protein